MLARIPRLGQRGVHVTGAEAAVDGEAAGAQQLDGAQQPVARGRAVVGGEQQRELNRAAGGAGQQRLPQRLRTDVSGGNDEDVSSVLGQRATPPVISGLITGG